MAGEIAEILRASDFTVYLDEGKMGAGETIVSKAAEGLTADVILLLLSSDSIPSKLDRNAWAPFLDHPLRESVVSVLCGDCPYPALLRQKNFFDAGTNRLGAFRDVKTWLLRLHPLERRTPFDPVRQPWLDGRDEEMEMLRRMLDDRPGTAVLADASPEAGKTALALEFSATCQDDFAGVIWLSCRGRRIASLAGDFAAQIGLQLEGDLESVTRDLQEHCKRQRYLIVLDDVEDPGALRLIPGGRSSTLLTTRRDDLGIEPIRLGVPRGRTLPRAPSEDARHLLASMCACGPGPFRLSLAAEVAGFGESSAAKLLARLREDGIVSDLDGNGPRYYVPDRVRDTIDWRSLARNHARAIQRLFTTWSWEQTREWDLAHLEQAFHWALSQPDEEAWNLARSMARTGGGLLKDLKRFAENYDILIALLARAEQKEDRATLDWCSRELIWVLSVCWDRWEEAEKLELRRGLFYGDQMSLNFGGVQ